jgi:rubrerythrin
MGNIFAGSEIVEMGIQIEKNGRDFYTALTAQATSEKASAMYKFLAGEEEKHIAVFQGLLGRVEKYEPQGLDADEYYAYMNALASGYIFTRKDQGAQAAKKIRSDREAVDMGIGFEKDSIIFYEGMKKVVPQHDHKVVDQMIVQEQGHLKQLVDLKKTLP